MKIFYFNNVALSIWFNDIFCFSELVEGDAAEVQTGDAVEFGGFVCWFACFLEFSHFLIRTEFHIICTIFGITFPVVCNCTISKKRMKYLCFWNDE